LTAAFYGAGTNSLYGLRSFGPFDFAGVLGRVKAARCARAAFGGAFAALAPPSAVRSLRSRSLDSACAHTAFGPRPKRIGRKEEHHAQSR